MLPKAKMLLFAAATDFELEPARILLSGRNEVSFLRTGVGPVEATFTLTRFLCRNPSVSAVINFGVAGAYLETGIGTLETCLAAKEVLADFGICLVDDILPLSEDIASASVFDLRNSLFRKTTDILSAQLSPLHRGTFLTVNCVSGTGRRGNMLAEKHQAICENMEGAAVARVCQGIGVELVELRVVSNMVDDRDVSRWQLKEACNLAAEQAALLFLHLAD